MLFDLGVSSLQLDEAEPRLRLLRRTPPLDMRMDQTSGVTAAEVRQHLRRRPSWPGCCATTARSGSPGGSPTRSCASARREPLDLQRAAGRAGPRRRSRRPTRRTGGHPAKRTFQALRIEVNGELACCERALPAAIDALAVGGRIVVLAYHSLEDRIVKRALAPGPGHDAARAAGGAAPAGPTLRLLTRGAEEPTEDEVAANPRAASARLRAAERIREAA